MNPSQPPLSARLFHLLADGQLHSGTDLARQLDVTRAAIWKHIRTLEDSGLPIVHQPRAGYRLSQRMQPLDPNRLVQDIQKSLPATQVQVCWQCPSTQPAATRLLQQTGMPAVVFCEWQTEGRGRRGRQWYSTPGASLVLSVAVSLPSGMSNLQSLPLLLGIRLAETLHQNGFDTVALKWPNDLVCWQNGKLHKLGGLLLTLQGEMEGPVTVTAGLGLNLYPLAPATPDTALPVAALTQLAPVDRNQLAAELACTLLQTLRDAPMTPFANLQGSYNQLHALHGRPVYLLNENNRLHGLVEGVDTQGRLLLQIGDQTLTITAGEISVRPDENPTD